MTTNVAANFTPRSVAALKAAVTTTGDTETDVLNRSVQLYAYIQQLAADGKLLFVEDPTTGTRERLILL